jgi:hypothetical protein
MTDLQIYEPGAVDQYQGRLAMTPEQAKELDDQVRRCTEAVLREGVDYGHIPGTNADEKSLWRPGAQKLLQWFGLGFSCERVEVERDDEGRKHGITYRATVARRLPDGSLDIRATCEGTADYDESKFYQPVEQVRARLRDQEHKWAAKDRRAPNADRWNSAKEYRADWNALMKRAQKRAIVGAVVDATAAGGIFSDREEDDSPVPQAGESSWYEQALETALSFTDIQAGSALYTQAGQAARDGLCTRNQKDHIQNRVRQRIEKLRNARPVDVEDLGRQGEPAGADGDGGSPEDEPGSASKDQLTKLHTILTGLGFGSDEREQKLVIAEAITGRAPLHGPRPGRSSGNLSFTEAARLIAKLDEFVTDNGERDRDALIAFMAAQAPAAGDDDA